MLRDLILKRIEEIKASFGADLFAKTGRRRKLPMGTYWRVDFDFSKLTDEQLVKEFEKVIGKSYRQR